MRKKWTHQFPVLVVKDWEKFQQNLNRGFRFSLPKNDGISWSRRENQNFSNFIGWFCVKDKLLGQKIERTVYFSDTDGLLKVSAQYEWWFPIQPTPSPKK